MVVFLCAGVCIQCNVKGIYLRCWHLMWAQSAKYKSNKINKIHMQPNTMNPTNYINTLQHFIQHTYRHIQQLHTHMKPMAHNCTHIGKAFRVYVCACVCVHIFYSPCPWDTFSLMLITQRTERKEKEYLKLLNKLDRASDQAQGKNKPQTTFNTQGS